MSRWRPLCQGSGELHHSLSDGLHAPLGRHCKHWNQRFHHAVGLAAGEEGGGLADGDEWPLITECLGEALAGPVIHDPRGEFYALVPPQTTETWSSPLARCLGRGAWVGVPRVDQNALQFGPYWSVPMERAGELCSPIAVAELVRLGHERLTSGAR